MSITQAPNGTYVVSVSFGTDPVTGKRRRKKKQGIHSMAAAREVEKEMMRTSVDRLFNQETVTLDELFERYVNRVKIHIKPSYLQSQRAVYKRYIQTFFVNADIKRLTSEHIRDFQEWLTEERDLSNNTNNKTLIELKLILDVAVEEKVIVENPCIGVKKLKIERKKMDFYTPDEFHAFTTLIHLPEEFDWYVLFSLLFFSGLRVGELCALDWSDLDFKRKELTVSKSVFRRGGVDVITPPKSKASNRRISLNQGMIALLLQWREQQQELFKHDLALDWSEDTPMFQATLIRRNKHTIRMRYKRICKRDPTMKQIRIHDFRHSHVALLIDQETEYTIIKERLGHASIVTTIDTYGHLFPNKQRETADALDKFF
ncbi:tyrosine-type recombinase/integrase [Lacticaseibacillus suibinensis]|uniref:tyrosine-type recombinase/integrase n=1 Tax=Lacticaseibacillus suibinensis TaxID=2486011 RepID=UPI0013DE2F7C|nr:site-specific integrase [Lacticaseibacillus suibinensis]